MSDNSPIATDRRGRRVSLARRAAEDRVLALLRDQGPLSTRAISERLGRTKPWRNPTTGEFAWHQWNAYPLLVSLERLGLVDKVRFDGWGAVFWKRT